MSRSAGRSPSTLPGAGRRDVAGRQGSLPPRQHRPTAARADRHAEGHPEHAGGQPDYDVAMDLPGYRLPGPPSMEKLQQIVEAVRTPVGRLSTAEAGPSPPAAPRNSANSSQDAVSGRHDLARPRRGLRDRPLPVAGMLGMHGTVYSNMAINEADCCWLLASGSTTGHGKLSEFAKHGRIVHVDIDASEINKNKTAHIAVNSDVKTTLTMLNPMIEAGDYRQWHQQVDAWRESDR